MTPALAVRGSIPSIIRNDEGLYQGDLVEYFQAVFNHAQNLRHPYHNFRHMLHVTWLCHQACEFYNSELTKRQKRDLLIAALFHDFDHSGMMGEDDLNIARALRALDRHIIGEDRLYRSEIAAIIRATEYPYKVPSTELPLSAQIIRDADLSQAFGVAWIQQVVFGLASEWGKDPLDVLRMQGRFHGGLQLQTEWARQLFPREAIDEKVQEAREILDLIEAMPVEA